MSVRVDRVCTLPRQPAQFNAPDESLPRCGRFRGPVRVRRSGDRRMVRVTERRLEQITAMAPEPRGCSPGPSCRRFCAPRFSFDGIPSVEAELAPRIWPAPPYAPGSSIRDQPRNAVSLRLIAQEQERPGARWLATARGRKSRSNQALSCCGDSFGGYWSASVLATRQHRRSASCCRMLPPSFRTGAQAAQHRDDHVRRHGLFRP